MSVCPVATCPLYAGAAQASALERMDALAQRFAGVSLENRRSGWPHPWRATLFTNKNERAEYRATCWGTTAEAAILALLDHVANVDRGSNEERP